MVLLIIFTGILLLTVGWLLLTPITLKLDSDQHFYGITIWGFGYGRIEIYQRELCLKMKTLGIPWRLYPMRWKSKKKQAKSKKPSRTPTSRASLFKQTRRVRRILNSFQLRHFYLALDTDDFVWNAYLYPLYPLLNRKQVTVNINFQGIFRLNAEVENRLIRMLWAFFR